MASPDFIPDSQFRPDGKAISSPDFVPNSNFVPDAPSEDYQGIGQKLLTAEEGLERGLSSGLSDVVRTKFEKYLPESLQSKAEDIQGRKEANPLTAFGSELAGTAGLLTATGGLGLAAPEGAGAIAKIASNAAQGALLSSANSVSSDLAFGDPQLAASKIASHAGISALYGGLLGGAGSAVLEGAGNGLKSLSKTITDSLTPDLSINPESLGPLDRIRMGFFQGMQTPEASEEIANKAAAGIQSLNDLTSMDDLSALSDASGKEAIESFDSAKKDFLKEFGDSKAKTVDPEEVMSFITNPASQASAKQTIAFNHFFKAISGLSEIKLSDENVGKSLKDAQGSLQDWLSELSSASETNPHSDIEYGGPVHSGGSEIDSNLGAAKPYSTKFDLPPGQTITPNYSEGITLGSGENVARVPSYGSERVSAFDKPLGYSLETIQSKIKNYQEQVSKLFEKQDLPTLSAGDVIHSLEEVQGAGSKIRNLQNAQHAIKNPPPPLGAGLATIAAHVPGGSQAFALLSGIRKYSGDGGLYRLGNDVASPLKILEGISRVTQKADEKMGDKARLIFTGLSSQARDKD